MDGALCTSGTQPQLRSPSVPFRRAPYAPRDTSLRSKYTGKAPRHKARRLSRLGTVFCMCLEKQLGAYNKSINKYTHNMNS